MEDMVLLFLIGFSIGALLDSVTDIIKILRNKK